MLQSERKHQRVSRSALFTRCYEAGSLKKRSYSNRLKIGQTEHARYDDEWFAYVPQYMWDCRKASWKIFIPPGDKCDYNEGVKRLSLEYLNRSISKLSQGPQPQNYIPKPKPGMRICLIFKADPIREGEVARLWYTLLRLTRFCRFFIFPWLFFPLKEALKRSWEKGKNALPLVTDSRWPANRVWNGQTECE